MLVEKYLERQINRSNSTDMKVINHDLSMVKQLKVYKHMKRDIEKNEKRVQLVQALLIIVGLLYLVNGVLQIVLSTVPGLVFLSVVIDPNLSVNEY